jgi:hypothetical protein
VLVSGSSSENTTTYRHEDTTAQRTGVSLCSRPWVCIVMDWLSRLVSTEGGRNAGHSWPVHTGAR